MDNRELGKCKKCGRGFLTLPKGSLLDRYGDPNWRPDKPLQCIQAGEWPVCGGEIEITEAGRRALDEGGGDG